MCRFVVLGGPALDGVGRLRWFEVDVEDGEGAEGLEVGVDDDGFAGELEDLGGEAGLAVDEVEGEGEGIKLGWIC